MSILKNEFEDKIIGYVRVKCDNGTGLGLAIVKHIVEIHDAKIELDSEPDFE